MSSGDCYERRPHASQSPEAQRSPNPPLCSSRHPKRAHNGELRAHDSSPDESGQDDEWVEEAAVGFRQCWHSAVDAAVPESTKPTGFDVVPKMMGLELKAEFSAERPGVRIEIEVFPTDP
jgi:hypothetical protein